MGEMPSSLVLARPTPWCSRSSKSTEGPALCTPEGQSHRPRVRAAEPFADGLCSCGRRCRPGPSRRKMHALKKASSGFLEIAYTNWSFLYRPTVLSPLHRGQPRRTGRDSAALRSDAMAARRLLMREGATFLPQATWRSFTKRYPRTLASTTRDCWYTKHVFCFWHTYYCK